MAKRLVSLGPAPVLAILALLLALVTAGIHIAIGAVALIGERPAGIAFYAMGTGYLVGMVAFLVTDRKRLVAWTGIGYTVLLIVAYFASWRGLGPPIGVADKAVEVLLLVVLAILSSRLHGQA